MIANYYIDGAGNVYQLLRGQKPTGPVMIYEASDRVYNSGKMMEAAVAVINSAGARNEFETAAIICDIPWLTDKQLDRVIVCRDDEVEAEKNARERIKCFMDRARAGSKY